MSFCALMCSYSPPTPTKGQLSLKPVPPPLLVLLLSATVLALLEVLMERFVADCVL